jgi:hypothetical protein
MKQRLLVGRLVRRPRHGQAPTFSVASSRFNTEDARARWLSAFVHANLAAAKPERVLGLRRDAFDFVDVTGAGCVIEPGAEEIADDALPTVALLQQLQDDFKTGYETLKAGGEWMLPEPIRYGIETWPEPIRYSFAGPGTRVIKGAGRGSFRSLFVAGMLDIVTEWWNSDRIRTCPRPKCGKLFLKVGRQVYCSAACSSITRWEKFQAKRRARDFKAEHRQRTAKRLGLSPKAKVQIGRG